MFDHEFLNRWEPEVIEPKEREWNSAGVSSICQSCENLDEDMVCKVRGFRMDQEPKVWACLDASGRKKPKEKARGVEIVRTYTVEVTQILKMGAEAADQAEQTLRKMTEAEIAAGVKAAMGVDDAKVRDVKIFRLDR